MKIKQKSFFFEDYNESEITVNNAKNNQPKVSLSRVTFLFYIFLSVILIFGIKIIYLSLSPDKNFFLQNINQNFIKERRDILDRNGVILARNINIYDAAVRPKIVKVDGEDPGSPENPKMLKKFLYCTGITTIIFIAIYLLMKFGLQQI